MTEPLFLNAYIYESATASLTLKTTNRKCKIHNFKNYLPFLGEMEHNCRAIETGAKQNFNFTLQTTRRKTWELNCLYDGQLVRLRVWELHMGNRSFLPDFDWCNTAYELRKAINGMMLTAGCFIDLTSNGKTFLD